MISEAEKVRFIRICGDTVRTNKTQNGIGTYQEKTLHIILKSLICEDENCHEIKIYPDTPDESGARESIYVADVLLDCDIFEIQTGGLYPLKKKIQYYLEQTSYNVTVVIPLAAIKRISWIDPATSEVGKSTRSPKKQSERDILPELFWLLPYINNRRLRFRTVLMEIDEYRLQNGWGRDGKRGSHRFERVPTALIDVVDLSLPADFIRLLPDKLPQPFTAADFGKASGWRGRRLYSVIKVFCGLGLIRPDIKRGRAQCYITIC